MFSFVVLTALTTAPGQLVYPPPPDPGCTCRTSNYAPQLSPPQALRRVDPVLRFNSAALDAIRAEKNAPPMASRALAILHTAMYDAVNAVEQTHYPYYANFKAQGPTSAEAAAAVAAHRTLIDLFPNQERRFEAALDAALAAVAEGEAKERGIELGQQVAEKILAWRARDGADQTVRYTPGTRPGQWQPTPPEFKPALAPHWGDVTCFAMRRGAQFRPSGPPALTSEAYAAAFNEVKALGSVNSTARTREQTDIAWFWADGPGTCTPPGHWNLIAQDVARARGLTLPENARLFALLNVAMADAAISCWECKYKFDLWRPVQGIRRADEVDNPQTVADRQWTPLITTPPFPSYTSGHSSFSGAGSTILARFLGSDEFQFTTASDGLSNVRRSFNSFWQAADEASMSRLYGGIHWKFDNVDGLTAGRALAGYVFDNFMTPLPRQSEVRLKPIPASQRR